MSIWAHPVVPGTVAGCTTLRTVVPIPITHCTAAIVTNTRILIKSNLELCPQTFRVLYSHFYIPFSKIRDGITHIQKPRKSIFTEHIP